MNRHKSFIKGALTGALIMLFAVGVCTKVPELSGLLLQKDSVTAKQERAEKKTEAKFKKIEKMIDQYYLYSDDVKQEDLEDAVYAGFLSALNDPYTVYYNEGRDQKEIEREHLGRIFGDRSRYDAECTDPGRSRLQRSMKTVRQKRQGF